MQFNVAVTWFFNRLNTQQSDGNAEYPPAPARLLQAALAGAYQAGDLKAIETARKAIQYLERQKPPEIYAAEPVFGTPFQHFVHNNVFKEYDSEEANRSKLLNPTLLVGSDSQVVYAWSLSDGAPPTEILTKAFNGLLALGHGDDMAFARIVETVPPLSRHYVPIRGGMDARLRVPRPGFLADLDLAHRSQDRSEITSVQPRSYALKENLSQLRRIATFELQQVESEKTFAVDETKAALVAAWVRHAAIEGLKGELSPERLAIIAGHARTPQGLRVCYLPLPTVGEHTDRMIRRVCISAPSELSDAIQLIRDVLPGRVLTDDEGSELCTLIDARSNAVFEHYTNAGTEFETVTPVIFPHHLTKNGRLDPRRVREVGKWFVEAGLPTPSGLSVDFQPEKFFAPAYVRHLPQYRLRVRFESQVAGPVAVGLGRFFGLGIFANRTGIRASERSAGMGHRNAAEMHSKQRFS
jgi:CRISPR-associated protein Csb2